MNFTPQQIADACRLHGKDLKSLPTGIDGAQLLWALAGNESSFGRNCTPRHEPAFDVGGAYSVHSPMPALLKEFGSAAACSYGPWQLMFLNAPRGIHPEDFANLEACATATVIFLNSLLERFHPDDLADIGQCWNHGSPTSKPSPGVVSYVDQLIRNYAVPILPERTT